VKPSQVDFTPVNRQQLWKSNETLGMSSIVARDTDMGHFFTYKGRKTAVLEIF